MIWRKHSEYSFFQFPVQWYISLLHTTHVCKPMETTFSRLYILCTVQWGSKAGIGPKGYYRCRQIISTNLGKHHLTWHRSALAANPTSWHPCLWSLGNATLVVAERSGWKQVLGASKLRLLAKGAHPYRKQACLEALRLATNKLTQRETGYPSWGHPTQLRISRGSTRLIYTWQLRRERGQWTQV